MKCLMLSAALVMVYWLDFGVGVPVKQDFDVQQLAGKWYAIAIVKTQGPPENIFLLDHTAEPKPNGDVLVRAQIPLKGSCKEENINLLHTEHAGVFSTEMKHKLRVVEGNAKSYYILSIESLKNGVLQLFGDDVINGAINQEIELQSCHKGNLLPFFKKPNVRTRVENLYLSRVRSLGFEIQQIVYLNTMDRCP